MQRELTKLELNEVSAGAIHWGIVAAIVGGFAFIAGVFDGYLRPYQCRK